ncbi:MAG: DUF1109 domain-containing protein [Sphingomonas sanxanigenens]|uniref:DUF1109 domain-containing protein n=1 Tax=Sphingomonas sanxanigenens TaxID=397260 RepID=A0A2W5ADQ0_9SPHN|nr:MAG: DUF1109 domain-containing protein [Sphingomonas sanxanigenens]
MNTDMLIDQLATDVKPVPRHSVIRRIGLGVAAGAIVTIGLVGLWLGFRADLMQAMHGFHFWMKWSYTVSLFIGSLIATARLARPDAQPLRWLWLLAIPVLLLAAVTAIEMMHAPPADWLKMWLGHSWKRCPWIVLMLAAPIFIGLLWSFRRMAPTKLRAAGAAAGMAAGACAATLYCMHCPEVSALFVLTWYSLGIVLAAAIGALIGPRFLRW